jgi:hypothetical protein
MAKGVPMAKMFPCERISVSFYRDRAVQVHQQR